MKTPDQNELRQLIAQALDGAIDETGRRALNEALEASKEARNYYREMMDLHARLHLEYNGGREPDHMPASASHAGQSTHSNNATPPARPTRTPIWFAAAAAVAITLIVVRFIPTEAPEAPSFATLQQSHAANWGPGDLPTRDGARLGAGNLTLKEGIAVIRFDSGTEVSLEAPVELQLLDAMNCHILNGTAVAKVPESASGFRIGTPSAMIIDHGTRFAVSFDAETGNTLTQVFEGLVDVENPTTGEVVPLRAGQRNTVQAGQTGPVTEGFDERFHNRSAKPAALGPEWNLRTPTQDAYIGYPLPTDSDVLLYIKHGEEDFHRKVYLEFDLTDIPPHQIETADLALEFAPTGLGLASHVPDATFAVYGLLIPHPDWDEMNLRPHNAPANIEKSGADLVASDVMKLGTFVVPQGVQRGRFGIDDPALTDYLSQHAGSAVTLVIVRETAETRSTGLVHGIASRRHPTLAAPTLAIRMRVE